MTPKECKEKIHKLRIEIWKREGKVFQIAKEHIKDFSSVFHHISDIFNCDKSPIGYCVFPVFYNQYNKKCCENCIFCHEPSERK